MFRQLFPASHPASSLVRRAVLGAFALLGIHPLDEEIELDPPYRPPPPFAPSQTGSALLQLAYAMYYDRIEQKDWQAFLGTLRSLRFKPRPETVMKDVDNGLVVIVTVLREKGWPPLTGDDEENITYFATPVVVTSFLDKALRPQKPQSP